VLVPVWIRFENTGMGTTCPKRRKIKRPGRMLADLRAERVEQLRIRPAIGFGLQLFLNGDVDFPKEIFYAGLYKSGVEEEPIGLVPSGVNKGVTKGQIDLF
jgi:hypothetical protein